VLLLSCGCGDGEADQPPIARLSSGDAQVTGGSHGIRLQHGGRELLTLPPSAFALGTVDTWDAAQAYDPYPILAESPGNALPPGLTWHRGTSATVRTSNADGFELQIRHEGGMSSSFVVRVGGSERFAAKLLPEPSTRPTVFLGVGADIDTTEGLYGLGELFDDVNQRGKLRAMQLELADLESGYNEAHVPVPLLIGTRGWGLFVESPYPGAFDVAKTDDSRVDAIFGTADASAAGLDVHLLAAPHPLDVTQRYYDITGSPRLPGPFALGPWVWRDENDDQAQVESDLDAIRDLDLATTAYWIDRPYATGVNTFDYDATQFPDSDAMLAKMKRLGFRTALWHTPYLDENDPSTQSLRDQAVAGGYYPQKTGIQFNKWGPPIDLTNPAAKAWWQGLIKQYVDRGVAGFKLDYGEDIVPNAFGAGTGWLMSDGSTDRTQHSRYQLFYHSAYAELLPDEDHFLLCRAGTYGDQKNVSSVWPGDLDASFALHGELRKDENGKSYKAVGGLPASVIAGLTLGPSGFPFYGADTGGYRHSPPNKEVFIRWFQQTALSTVMQIGTSTNDVAWEPTAKNGFDAEVLDLYRRYTRLHLRLFPYIWSYAKRLAVDGRPIQRALGLAHPEGGSHPNFDYLLGDHLLVAPVVEDGARSRSIEVPASEYHSWWDNTGLSGPGSTTVDAPLDTLPLYIAAGGIVPMLRPSIDTLSPTEEPTRVDSFATTPGKLYVRIAPGPDSEVGLYDGGKIAQRSSASEIRIELSAGSVFTLGTIIELVTNAAPKAVDIDGKASKQLSGVTEVETISTSHVYAAGPRSLTVIHAPAGAKAVVVRLN
jgi:alpha-D-xyloside xylohydrolase